MRDHRVYVERGVRDSHCQVANVVVPLRSARTVLFESSAANPKWRSALGFVQRFEIIRVEQVHQWIPPTKTLDDNVSVFLVDVSSNVMWFIRIVATSNSVIESDFGLFVRK